MAVFVWSLLIVPLLLGAFLRRRWRLAAVIGFPVALAVWGFMWVTGAFEDDYEGTAWFLTLVYGVPIYTVVWAALTVVGHMVRSIVLRVRQRSQSTAPQ